MVNPIFEGFSPLLQIGQQIRMSLNAIISLSSASHARLSLMCTKVTYSYSLQQTPYPPTQKFHEHVAEVFILLSQMFSYSVPIRLCSERCICSSHFKCPISSTATDRSLQCQLVNGVIRDNWAEYKLQYQNLQQISGMYVIYKLKLSLNIIQKVKLTETLQFHRHFYSCIACLSHFRTKN